MVGHVEAMEKLGWATEAHWVPEKELDADVI